MTPDSQETADDAAQLRQALNTRLTVIQVQTELLQRQLGRRTGLSAVDRRGLERGLATILKAARVAAAEGPL